MNRTIIISSLIMVLQGCHVSHPTRMGLTPGMDSTIVLIDIKPEMNRLEIASLIDSVDSMQPAVIGMNIFFLQFKNAHDDSVLSKSIANSGKVILAAGMSDGKLLRSEYIFEDHALDVGIVKFIVDQQDRVTHYIGLYENGGQQDLSFPGAVHFYFTRLHSINFPRFRVNGSEPIVYSKRANQFLVLNPKNLRLDDIKGKIIPKCVEYSRCRASLTGE